MVNISCPQGKYLITDRYGYPMPIIGLYIAFASLVCFLCMAFDVWSGFRRRKIWLPCKLFSLNSFTLTILAVATKLSVDLNTPMPRSIEQLSKLSSNVLLVISMAYFMPSLKTMRKSECKANWIALNIIVLTVIVNISIQMATGVIFKFFVEHVIIMCCMVLLLVEYVSSDLRLDPLNDLYGLVYRRVVESPPREWGLESMRRQLKKLYAFSYGCNPQFSFCETVECAFATHYCGFAVLALLEAAIRSIALSKTISCSGNSDYKFSMWFVVGAQMLTITMGTFVVFYRWLIVVSHTNLQRFRSWKDVFIIKHKWDRMSMRMAIEPLGGTYLIALYMKKIILMFYVGFRRFGALAWHLSLFSCLMVRKFVASMIPYTANGSTSGGEWMDVKDVVGSFGNDEGLIKWKSRIAMDNMNRLMEVIKKKPKTHLTHLLSKTFPTSPPQTESILSVIQQRGQSNDSSYRVSFLSVVIVARLTASSVSSSLDDSLDEIIDLLSFIDKKMNAKGNTDGVRLGAAKELWHGRRMIDWWVEKEIIAPAFKRIPPLVGNSAMAAATQEDVNLRRALSIIEEIRNLANHFDSQVEGNILKTSIVEIDVICNSILACRYASMAQLSQYLEQTYLEMVHAFLTDLPRAIFRDYYESPIEECEERLTSALEFSCKLEILGDKIKWSWPNETDFIKGATQVTVDATQVTAHITHDPPPEMIEEI